MLRAEGDGEPTDLLEFLCPGLLGPDEARLHVLRLLESSKHLLVEGVLLPAADAVAVLRHQRAADGGVQRGEAVGGRQEALPGLQQGAVQRT